MYFSIFMLIFIQAEASLLFNLNDNACLTVYFLSKQRRKTMSIKKVLQSYGRLIDFGSNTNSTQSKIVVGTFKDDIKASGSDWQQVGNDLKFSFEREVYGITK